MSTIRDLLDRSRKELLDLSTRNRLLSIPVQSKSARIVQVHDERSEHVFETLVQEKKTMSFLPGKKSTTAVAEASGQGDELAEDEIGLPQPDDDYKSENGPAKRHLDARLQTSLSPEGLQRRLLDLYRDAQTMIEEQGVNILFLALGHLKWFEADVADTPRFAPLILLPVELERRSASERFHLKWREEEITENVSLAAKLKHDFGIQLPEFPEEEQINPADYFDKVANAVSGAKGWEVLPNSITLGFFSFAKFLMYHDLDCDTWQEPDRLVKHPFITGLLQDGFPVSDALIPDTAHLDEVIPVSRLDHVVDADASQSIAIETVRQGRSLVIQGPPGTGKSQSITNIIATAVLDGKRVLFVAEKLAALEVVKRRLEREGLGPLCLELHSNKSNKRLVIEEIGRTWKLGKPKAKNLEGIIPKLDAKRSILNKHVAELHTPWSTAGLMPYQIMGHLAKLGEEAGDIGNVGFEGAEAWTSEHAAECRSLVEELASRIDDIGLPAQHPWRGVCRETVLNIDLPAIKKLVESVRDQLVAIHKTTSTLAAALDQPVPLTIVAVEEQKIIAEYVAEAPSVDKEALCHSVWNAGLEGLGEVLEQGRTYEGAVAKVGRQVTELAWEKDFAEVRAQIAAHGKSLFRVFKGSYRAAIAEFRAVLKGEMPKGYSARVEFADDLIKGQRALKGVRESSDLAQNAFGSFWRKDKSDWKQLDAILNWVSRQREVGLDSTFRQMFAGVKDQNEIGRLREQLANELTGSRDALQRLTDELKLSWPAAFGCSRSEESSIAAVLDRCEAWLNQLEALIRWNTYFVRSQKARSMGLGCVVERLENGQITSASALVSFDRVYYTQLLRELVRQKPHIAQFDGVLHDGHVAEFKTLDKERLLLAKYLTLLAHTERMPPFNSSVGPAGIVKGEMERKRGHRTVRRLLKDAGSVVQAIKPVFMMSPLSVAQFLEPGAVEFDLLVVDEASQVQPVDALGAVARCKQVVVVGDSKQLPPTRFFMRLTGESEGEEELTEAQAAEAKDIESILGLCCARGLPQAMLRWHYRSRHHSLIAVSNHEFYEDRLFIIPSPYSAAAGMGLKFNYVPDGVFDSGGSGTNRVEAKAICNAVIDHARNASHLSLGVAAFSIRQRQAILDELELLRRENPDTEAFFHSHPTEPFFAKNLENVQGDERDVIFISVGYGRDVHGYMAMRFGPLSAEGGERRLNVLISRAKQRCEVFSSIKAEDIDLERATGRGVAALKTFLSFAETGRLAIAGRSGLEEQSPFEEAIHRAVEQLGYEVHPQVGIAGFYIDLAVLDRERQGRYLLGIECDGAGYHSSRAARDRDRLRQAVLEDHGWIIHRIWSTDWFQRPKEQLQKLVDAVERAKVVLNEMSKYETPKVSVQLTLDSDEDFERETVLHLETKDFSALSRPYEVAKIEVPHRIDPHDLPAKEMADILFKIVQQEGPIHEDELLVRIRDIWGLGRAGSRIQDAVARGARSLIVSRRCTREDGFLSIPEAPVFVRNRENASSAALRRPEMLPPAEIRAAVLALIDANHGASRKEVPIAVGRMLGFRSTSSQLRHIIATQLGKLVRERLLQESQGMLRRSSRDNIAICSATSSDPDLQGK